MIIGQHIRFGSLPAEYAHLARLLFLVIRVEPGGFTELEVCGNSRVIVIKRVQICTRGYGIQAHKYKSVSEPIIFKQDELKGTRYRFDIERLLFLGVSITTED